MAATIIKKIVKKISDAARKKATADRIKRFEHAGPHEGEVIIKKILGKPTKKGDRTKAAVKDAMKVKEIGKEYGAKPHATGGRVGLKTGLSVRRGIQDLHEHFGGGVEGKPHSTKKGRIASGKRRLERFRRKAMNDYHDELWAGKDPEKGKPHSSQEGRIATGRRNFRKALQRHAGGAKPLRAKHGLGSLVKGVKKIISKIKPKPPKGVAVKPVPKVVTDVDKPFKGYDKSYTRADDKKMDALLKKLGDEIKAQPLPPKTKDLVKKLQKAYPHHDSAGRNKASKKVFKSAKGKAAGGRIGLKHGGSAGAAIRGRGAEIK